MATDPHVPINLGFGVSAVMDRAMNIVISTHGEQVLLPPSVAVNLVKWIESFVEEK